MRMCTWAQEAGCVPECLQVRDKVCGHVCTIVWYCFALSHKVYIGLIESHFSSFYAITLLSLGTAFLVWMWHCPQNKVVSYRALEDVAIFFISAMQSGISES